MPKEPGDKVVAGTVAAGGSLRVRVTAVGEETALVRDHAARRRRRRRRASRAQALADRAAALLFYVALAAGAITLVFWWLLGDPEGALVRTATVLVIACPHALGLAIPLVIAISTSLGARNGLLVKDRLALERARELDRSIFDKTGTLTTGQPVLARSRATAARRGRGAARSPRRSRPTPSIRSPGRSSPARSGVASTPRRRPGSRPGRARRPGRVDDRARSPSAGPRLLAELGLEPRLPRSEAWAARGPDGAVRRRRRPRRGRLALEDEIRPESAEAVAEPPRTRASGWR